MDVARRHGLGYGPNRIVLRTFSSKADVHQPRGSPMLKFAFLAAFGLLAAGCAHEPPAYMGPAAYAGPPPMAQPVAYRGRTCPPGTRPAGNAGCVGQELTGPDASGFDEHMPTGCREAPSDRVVRTTGTDANGRPIHWVLRQHRECRNGQPQS